MRSSADPASLGNRPWGWRGAGTWSGPLASRPHDSLNFQATWFKFSKKQVGFEDDVLLKAKSGERFSRNETMLELN